jgi:hypothetical protein
LVGAAALGAERRLGSLARDSADDRNARASLVLDPALGPKDVLALATLDRFDPSRISRATLVPAPVGDRFRRVAPTFDDLCVRRLAALGLNHPEAAGRAAPLLGLLLAASAVVIAADHPLRPIGAAVVTAPGAGELRSVRAAGTLDRTLGASLRTLLLSLGPRLLALGACLLAVGAVARRGQRRRRRRAREEKGDQKPTHHCDLSHVLRRFLLFRI